MDNEPEVIRQQMEEHRTALTEKLEQLEDRVLGVATAVSETVENVKNEVAEQWIAHGWATQAGAAKEPPPRPARRK